MFNTYSVIIQNQKTLRAFSRYMPFFSDAIDNKSIGICRWFEGGTTLENTVPELNSLIDDKEEWRAVIVRYLDDDYMAGHIADSRNPFDFKVNKNSDGEVERGESSVPLIRLTHMLGGVPEPELVFRSRIEELPGHKQRMIYEPVENQEARTEIEELNKKYQINGKRPTSIILISIQNKDDNADDRVDNVWLLNHESKSSEFWKRNRYPSRCRFLVYDFHNEGTVQQDADEFGLWMTVRLLATNIIDAAALQGYRIYNTGVDLDCEVMKESFQNRVDKLRDIRDSLKRDIYKKETKKADITDTLPSYRMAVSVDYDVSDELMAYASVRMFGLTSDGGLSEISRWNEQQKKAEESLERAVRKAERALDQSADHIRPEWSFDEEEVEPLNRYQEEDLEREASKIYSDIVQKQGLLPKGRASVADEIEKVSDSIRNFLTGRVVRHSASKAILMVLIALIISNVPMVIRSLLKKEPINEVFLYVTIGEMIIVILFAILTLILQRSRLRRLIHKYNRHIKNEYNSLRRKSTNYSDYLSDIVSYSRACSYMEISKDKKRDYEQEESYLHAHVKAINILLSKIRSWSKAHYIKLDFDSKRQEVDPDFMALLAPEDNPLYSLAGDKQYPIEINHSGIMISAPFHYIRRLKLVREEVYDDENS